MTPACEDANLKLADVVTVTDIDEDCFGNSLLQIRKLKFGHKAQGLVKFRQDLKLELIRYFGADVL